jgi:hypothetical protein
MRFRNIVSAVNQNELDVNYVVYNNNNKVYVY